jgi:Serine/threonine protein kinase
VSILEFKDLIYLSDLKLENILMSFENEHILTDFIKRPQPMQFKVDNESGRTIYRCHNDFGALDGREIKNMVSKITDFGLATRLDRPSTRNGIVAEQLGIYPIQPDYYRAPEVILGCGWDFKADIWNFGVLVRLCTCFRSVNLQHNGLFSPLAWA